MESAAPDLPPRGPSATPPGPGTPVSPELHLGDYLLLEEIAHGGMGVVYRARQISLNRAVAVKLLLLGRYSGVASIERFRREAQSAAALRHPNIVAIHEVGEADGQHFISMELVEGRNLAEVLCHGPLPSRRAAVIARSLADAIHYAHSQGILHRDLKPSNVLIDPFGEVRITDFGLAKKLDGTSDLTLTGQMVGTPNYLSPEAAAGRRGEVGPASDVYSIGAILYELLSGRPPFLTQSLQETLLRIRDTETVSLRRQNRAIPRDLEIICLKCLAKRPAQRYPRASDLASDLASYLDGQPIQARPVSVVERGWKWVRRNRAWAAVILTATASLLTLSIGSFAFSARVNRAREQTEATSRRLARGLFIREWRDAENLVQQDKATSALMWFARALRDDPTHATTATRLMTLLGAHNFAVPAFAPLNHPAAVRISEFSPGGGRLATVAGDGMVRLWRLENDGGTAVLPHRFAEPVAGFLPGNGRLVVADRSSLSVWDPDGTRRAWRPLEARSRSGIVLSPDGRTASVTAMDGNVERWEVDQLRPVSRHMPGPIKSPTPTLTLTSRDGRYLVCETPQNEVEAWEIAEGRRAWIARPSGPAPAYAPTAIQFSHDGEFLAVGYLRGRVVVYAFRPRRTGVVSSPPPDPPVLDLELGTKVTDLCFDHQGGRLFVGNMNGSVYVCDLSSGKLPFAGVEHQGRINSLRVSRDDTRLATASDDETARIWDIRMNLPAPRMITNSSGVSDARISPDGTRFVVAGEGEVVLHNLDTGAVLHRLKARGAVHCAAFSPHGSRVVASTEAGEVRVWDARTGAPLVPVIQLPHSIRSVAFSPNGRWFRASTPGNRIWIFETRTGTLVGSPLTNVAHVVRAPFSPDLRTLAATTTQGHVTFWSLPEGSRREAQDRHRGVIWMAGFSPDGDRLLTASSDRRACLWEVAEGRISREFPHVKPVYHARFSPDGRAVLTGSADGTAVIWDTETGKRLSEPMRHPGDVWYGEFTADGGLVITGDDLGNARVWDARSGLPVGPWIRAGSLLKRATFSPDGGLGLVASENGVVRLWPVFLAPSPAPHWLADLADSLAGYRLAPEGAVERVSFERFAKLHRELKALSDDDFYSRWVRWFLIGRMSERPGEFQP